MSHLRLVPIEHALDPHVPGYCTCGRWGFLRTEGPTDRTCPGLLAVERGEPVPSLDRVLWERLRA